MDIKTIVLFLIKQGWLALLDFNSKLENEQGFKENEKIIKVLEQIYN
ncbi:hypothetical protein [Campylobacter sp.]|nr:hypothetical protein [Campylobacter sp.]MCI7076341.1 hypothetical protein [Campylobacter sp.]